MSTLRVFNIEKYRIHDGVGIRTAIFLKGCHLKCPWCCNPESQSIGRQMAIFRNICVNCMICQHVCSRQAVFVNSKGVVDTEMSKCDYCGMCVSMCPRSARKIYGKDMTLEEIMQEVRKDAAYYSRSGGGVTISGGEPLLQWEKVIELIDECHMEMYTVSLETCGFIEEDIFMKAALKADELLIDVKTTDIQKVDMLFGKHVDGKKRLEQLKQNIRRAVEADRKVVLRCPIIPEFNNSRGHIENVIGWAREVGCRQIDLLPFHQYGKVKYQSLNMNYDLQHYRALDNEEMQVYKGQIEREGIDCIIGG